MIENALVEKAETFYKNNSHFRKQLNNKSKDNRQTLYMFMEHWLKGIIKGMKKIYIIGQLVNDTPTTKIEKYRFCHNPKLINKITSIKSVMSLSSDSLPYWKWFNTMEDAELYIKNYLLN